MATNTTAGKKKFWRSMDELEHSPEFRQHLQHEFGDTAEDFPEGVSRRRWLQLMGASLSLGGLVGCRFENVNIRPYAFRPQNRVPGEPEKYATTIEWAGSVRPLVATSFDGRPIKLDGNPDHPMSKGGSDIYSQGCILSLYDPDRSRGLRSSRSVGDAELSWEDFGKFFGSLNKVWANDTGKGFAVLAEPSASPARKAAREAFEKKFSDAQWFEYESISRDNERDGLQKAFGKAVRPLHDFSKAEVVLCLDADPLGQDSDAVANIRGWSEARDAEDGKMSRTFVLESNFSVTGSNADHRWPVRSRDIAGFTAALSGALTSGKAAGSSVYERRLALIASELSEHKGTSLIVAGPNQPAEVHAAVALLNSRLDNVGRTVTYIDDPAGDRPSSLDAISDLAAKIDSGEISSLMVIGCNPAYDAPAELDFANKIKSLKSKIHLGLYDDETGLLCDWHLNLAHPLEVWGDAVAADGSYCVSQPLINPIFGAKSATEVLSMLAGVDTSGVELVQASAKKTASGLKWEQTVHDGFVADSQADPVSDSPSADAGKLESGDGWKNPDRVGNGSYELVFNASSTVFDGRFANNGWLQELPDPISKLTWGNVALLSPQTAAKIEIKQGNAIRLKAGNGELDIPVFIQPGMALGTIAVSVGYGRKVAGFVGGDLRKKVDPVGVDVAPIRSIDAWSVVDNCTALSRGGSTVLPHTQDHHAIDITGLNAINDRWDQLIQIGSYDDFTKFKEEHPSGAHADHGNDDGHGHEYDHEDGVDGDHDEAGGAKTDAESHDKDHGDEHGGHEALWPVKHHHHPENKDLTPNDAILTAPLQWGMSIDLNKCVGCNACVIACQAENNIPVVGADQVKMGREMQWLRIDRYLAADDSYDVPTDDPEPQIQTQPVTCQHCETAPCETVCPVAATVHSAEGLNDMVYNRCIGTRYCGNNCPFKVRRFNFFNYSEAETFVKYPWENKRGSTADSDRSLQNMVMNPDVSIRSRGVMEKCTFCVQRIQNAKIKASNEGRSVGGDEIVTACQQACPAQAIEFGNLNDKESKVAKAHANPRRYRMLDYLNLRQRTVYLTRIRNEHKDWPKLVKTAAKQEG